MSAKSSKLETFIFADLLATVMLAVLAYGTVEPWSLALFELNALLLAVLLAVRFTFNSQSGFGLWRLALPLLALTVLAFIQAFVPSLSLDHYATKEAAIKLLALAIYLIAALHTLRSSERRKKVLVALAVFGFVVSLFAILQRLTYNGKMYWVRPVSPYIAPYGPYGNYNHFAGLVELLLPLSLAYLLFARIKFEQRLIWLVSVVMMAVALVFSGSRGGILALGIELLALMLVTVWAQRRGLNDDISLAGNKLIAGGALAAVLLLVLWIGYEPLAKRFSLLRQGAGEYSLVTRTEYWSGAWKMFLDHPLTGVGLGAFPTAYPAYGRSSVKNERLEQAHNDYLQLLSDAGLIGGLIGLWFLFELFRIARRQFQQLERARSNDRALLLGGYVALLGIAVHSLLDFNLQIAANALLFLFVLALTVAPKSPKEEF
ncbi:MAG TPA: O-antigen ligase family protein [Blastocatellia bacterium]|nr:O-antigen ligase family protein [Blastocatellia bacterium]